MPEEIKQPKTADTKTVQLYNIEELHSKKKTPQSIYSGVCVAFGWKQGKVVTETEYDEAVSKFSGSPIGKKVK